MIESDSFSHFASLLKEAFPVACSKRLFLDLLFLALITRYTVKYLLNQGRTLYICNANTMVWAILYNFFATTRFTLNPLR